MFPPLETETGHCELSNLFFFLGGGAQVHSLSIHLDSSLSLDTQLLAGVRNVLATIKTSVPAVSAPQEAMVTHTLVTSHLYYCN